MKFRKLLIWIIFGACLIIIASIKQLESRKRYQRFAKIAEAVSSKTTFKYSTRNGSLPVLVNDNVQDTKTVSFTKMNYGPVYILNVAAGNTSENAAWDIFKIYASIDISSLKRESKILIANKTFICCLMYEMDNNVNFVQEKPENIYKFSDVDTSELHVLTAFHFTCPNKLHSYGILPKGVGLSVAELSCNHKNMTYIKPFYPEKAKNTKLAISTKLAFGKIDAELIIEWMETYKYLGVDKVLTYVVRDINPQALAVLKYYESTGILDLYEFKPAAEDLYPRRFHPPDIHKWNDARMVSFDAFEKMSGYTYFGIIDHDEFLIPTRNRSLKQMLDDLFKEHPQAAGFTFKTQFYYLSWGKSGAINDLILGTYVNRVDRHTVIDNKKNIYKPELVIPGSISTHYIEPSDAMIVVDRIDGYLRHFRECKQYMLKKCMETEPRVKDLEMAEWSKRIQDNVHDARHHIFGKEH